MLIDETWKLSGANRPSGILSKILILIGIALGGFGVFAMFCFTVITLGLIISFPVMWLWNGCLVGAISGIEPIETVWQAWGLIILCSLLFKSLRK